MNFMGIFLPFAILCNFHVVLTFSTAITFFSLACFAKQSTLRQTVVVVVVVADACHEILQSRLAVSAEFGLKQSNVRSGWFGAGKKTNC